MCCLEPFVFLLCLRTPSQLLCPQTAPVLSRAARGIYQVVTWKVSRGADNFDHHGDLQLLFLLCFAVTVITY